MSFGVTELMIIAVIVLLLFGTTKLKSLGSDLGTAIKGFKSAMDENKTDTENTQLEADEPSQIPGANQTTQTKETNETNEASQQEKNS
ncbi:MAG: twin-arginine translocase TatA/TatE family subunit [Pseudomonadales bacterium]|nr:twin-arginine translocase TatA/TatE family subunit [Pseudomonadales bacterium]